MAGIQPRDPASDSVRTAPMDAHLPEARAGDGLFDEVQWQRLQVALALTARQCEMARLICGGLGYKAIAARSGISINTVRMHMQALFRRLGAHDRVSVVLQIVAMGRTLADGVPP